ncbi:MAG: hypothetical protein NZ839_04315, partial [Endomicrobia bacterium]|nr:hypothetical protein [Endomicrobiia bacterium]
MKNLLCIFMGGDRKLDDAFTAVRELTRVFVTKCYITKAGTKIIGVERIRQELPGVEIISDNANADPHQLSLWADVLLVPVLTLNGLSKIVSLM